MDKEWVDKWKKYSYYEKIKTEYLENDDKNKIIELIKDEQVKSGLNYEEIYENDNFIIKKMNQFKSQKNTKKEFEILNKKFLQSFNENIEENINPFDFFVSYKNIEIRLQDKPIMSFETSNNIISIDKNIDNSKRIETQSKLKTKIRLLKQIKKNLVNKILSQFCKHYI